jgi:hypothetical protein
VRPTPNMYVSEITACLLSGMFTPAIRAITNLHY